MDNKNELNEELELDQINDEQLNELMDEQINQLVDDKENAILDDSTKLFLNELRKFPSLSTEEQKILFRKYKMDNDMEAYDKLFHSNLRLCVFMARRTIKKYKSLSFLDLIQEYSLTLMNAIEKYDMSNNITFSTYACRAMTYKSSKLKIYADTNVKLSYRNTSLYKEYQKFKMEFENIHHRVPTKEEVLAELNISDNQYYFMLMSDNVSEQSLNQTVRENNDKASSELMNFIADQKNEYQDNEKFIDEQILKKSLWDQLTSKEYYIIYYRFIAQERKHLREIADEFGCSRQAIHKLLKKILEQISPILEKYQKETLKKYSIKEILEFNLEPLSPIEITTLHYLKGKLPKINYQILYTILVNYNNHNLKYYHRKYPFMTQEEIQEEIDVTLKLRNEFFNDLTMNKIFEQYRSKYTISGIFELDVKPAMNQNYHKLARYIEQLTYDEIKDEEYIKNLDTKSKKLLMRYFNVLKSSFSSANLPQRIERDINLSLLGYFDKQRNFLTKNTIRDLLKKNKSYLTSNQIELINELYLFGNHSAQIIKNKPYLDLSLWCLKFGFHRYFENELTVAQIKEVEEKNPCLITSEKKTYIHAYYGVDTDKKKYKRVG